MEEEDCIKPPKSGLCGWGCGYGVVVVGRYSSESRMELRVSVRFFCKMNDASVWIIWKDKRLYFTTRAINELRNIACRSLIKDSLWNAAVIELICCYLKSYSCSSWLAFQEASKAPQSSSAVILESPQWRHYDFSKVKVFLLLDKSCWENRKWEREEPFLLTVLIDLGEKGAFKANNSIRSKWDYQWESRNAIDCVTASDVVHSGPIISWGGAARGSHPGRPGTRRHLLHIGMLELPLPSSPLVTLTRSVTLHVRPWSVVNESEFE